VYLCAGSEITANLRNLDADASHRAICVISHFKYWPPLFAGSLPAQALSVHLPSPMPVELIAATPELNSYNVAQLQYAL